MINRIKGNIFWSVFTFFSVFIVFANYQNCSQKTWEDKNKIIKSSSPGTSRTSSIPLFLLPGTEEGMETFVRVTNPSNSPITVSITVFKDVSSSESFGPWSLSVGPNSVVMFNSRDLHNGNSSLGWTVGLNRSTEPSFLRLHLSSNQKFFSRGYVRFKELPNLRPSVHPLDGVKLSMKSGTYVAPIHFFNPAGNTTFQSRLRLINPHSTPVNVSITGVMDDEGKTPDDYEAVSLTLQAGEAKMITSQQLEEGDSSSFDGRFGDGAGKWRFSIQSNSSIQVMNLIKTPGKLYSID